MSRLTAILWMMDAGEHLVTRAKIGLISTNDALDGINTILRCLRLMETDPAYAAVYTRAKEQGRI